MGFIPPELISPAGARRGAAFPRLGKASAVGTGGGSDAPYCVEECEEIPAADSREA